jgi:hypothetical protein
MITTQVSYTKNRSQHNYWRQFILIIINLQNDNMIVSVFRSNNDMIGSNNQLLASLVCLPTKLWLEP